MAKGKQTSRSPKSSQGPKQPHIADPGLLRPVKRPVSLGLESILDSPPSWRLHKLDLDGPFGWRGLSGHQLDEIRAKLAEFESLSWREIKVEQADRHHLISIGKMSPEAQKRLRKILPEMDELFSLRLSGKGRIFGILQERGAMLVVWWDPDHEVCPVRR
jgi:hypothetical protein